MDWTVRLPSILYRLAVKKAGGDRELQAHIRGYLESWTGTHPPKIGTHGTVYCPDCQQVHTPGPCSKG